MNDQPAKNKVAKDLTVACALLAAVMTTLFVSEGIFFSEQLQNEVQKEQVADSAYFDGKFM